MGGPSPGGFTPHTAGVGQMKLETPPRYSGKKQPSVRTWLSQMERYMRLMKYAPTDWLDVVAMRVDGAANSWVNAVLQEVSDGWRQAFRTWGQFKVAMCCALCPGVVDWHNCGIVLGVLQSGLGIGWNKYLNSVTLYVGMGPL